MSNFKSNNRFNFLNENETADKNGNSKRDSFSKKDFDNKPKYQTYNKFKSDEKYIPQKKEFQMKENEFPELLTSNLEKKSDTIEQALVSSSWISYKVDHTQFKLNETFTFKSTTNPNPIISKNKKEVELNEAEEIIEALSFLHEKRTEEYIELWGEEEWERMFIFPNHDYEYFDKLDEAYEIEQNKINEQYSNYDSYGENYYDDEI